MKKAYEVKMYIDGKDWGGQFFFSYIKARECAEIMMNWGCNRAQYHEIKYGADKGSRCVVFKPIIRHWRCDKYDIYVLKVKVQ